ncbi:NAD(P)H-dependent glycerol-3-phosphate dehydrogenase [uncultured Roseobacter sp.]|uniref:NAD(P)H-dependent glycerol-3-phosphate dehydrogenase n=1 Tax=uncultured Roseobacter sp. TaxID=114847 RepID=UPI0026043C8F|nr:NAD(P)H-dependent glycerol-3-phosphate dehydrogenase [uncultured Roseobacter sp.]
MSVSVLGSGAFGTALALSLAGQMPVTLWARDAGHAQQMQTERCNRRRLGDFAFPETLTVTDDLHSTAQADTLLLALPLQQLRGFLTGAGDALSTQTLVACCKGMELRSGAAPHEIIDQTLPHATPAILTGPGFARDIAAGLPTAMTLACADPGQASRLQALLSGATLRLYRSTDMTGAALGGALKNVVAIACGAAMGAGLGESARAALMTRGNAEMARLAERRGADPATLSGLSGFGDLVLTCTSEQSRNYRYGLAIGASRSFDQNTTVEGAATALAMHSVAQENDLDLPITSAVAGLVENRLDVAEAMSRLLSRTLKEE